MERSRKRRRVPVVVQASSRRPIDKRLINVSAAVINTQQNISLITATFPATITGLRWSLTFKATDADAAGNDGAWCIIRIKDGVAPNNFSFTNAGTLMTPEQEVIAFGRWAVNTTLITNENGPSIQVVEGSTKSMRKLMAGDQIYFLVNGTQAVFTVNVKGTIQFFSKT